MGFFDFAKDAGDKLFKRANEPDNIDIEAAKAESLRGHVIGTGVPIRELGLAFDDGTATVTGVTKSQADREKILLTIGNTYGVARVNDQITVEAPAPEPAAQFYTVVSGDTLGKIAKAHYGNAMKYPRIFEANRPMLKDPDKIYPGQVLRIPAGD